ncbi:MAG TPA: outer membrane protein assembly factor BamA [Spirochaetia bacterium]|nr:outer membrane protein assembly factor BamA [Spirochaetia bacterium]
MTVRAATAVLGSLILFHAAVGLPAQDSGTAPAPSAGSPAEPAADWYVDKPIVSFSFQGLVTVKEADLQGVLRPYIGQKFSVDPLLMDIQAKLYALDYFESIEPNALPGDAARSTLIIQFKVKERPSITAIEVHGNATVRTGDITDKILLKKGDLANQGKLQADVEAVKSMYLDKGYTEATVSAAFVPGTTAGTVRAVFTVSEGVPTTIKEIHFSGNTFASENTLRGVMKTKVQSLFDSGVFQEAKLEDDKAAIVAYYTDRGYVDAKIDQVTRTVQTQSGRNYLVVTVYLTEGEQWKYGGMTISGNTVFSTQRLTDLLTQKPGKILSLQKEEADVNRVRSLYYDNGYIFNGFTTTQSRDPATKTISYTLTITEADKAHIENIIFKGNTKTKENVLRRGLPFEEGDIFNREKIIQGYQYLQNLQYFKSVTPDTQPGSEYGLMNVIFALEETSTADINFGLTFSGGDFPISGTIKWNERNFQGSGQTLGIDLEASPIQQMISFNFLEPWMFNKPWSGGISLSFDHETVQNVLQDIRGPVFTDGQQAIAAPDPYSNRDDYLNDLANGVVIGSQYLMTYDMWDITLGLSTGYTFTYPFGRLGIQAGYAPQIRRVDYDESLYRPFEKTVRDNNHGWDFIDKVSAGVSLDGRDIYWNPTKGYLLSQNVSFVGGLLFGQRSYIRSDTTAEGFLTLLDLPVTEGWDFMLVAAAHSGVSMILPNFGLQNGAWGWNTVTDYTDQLYIDGMTVGRGWRLVSGYGNALFDNKLEVRMPISKDILWLVGFLDAAALFDQPFGAIAPATSLDSMNLNNFYFSSGFGIRFTIPQFPIRLYLAKGFQVKNGSIVPKPPATGDLAIGNFNFSFVISLGGNVF